MGEMNWIVIPVDNSVQSVNPGESFAYDLFNTTEKEALEYGERKYGINLKWGEPAGNLRFHRESGSNEPVKYGELVAIGVRGGGFLHNQTREYGIGLVWRDLPCCEWQIRGGNTGEDVKAGAVVGLFNTVAKDFIFYDPRTYGINLKWLADKGKYNKGLVGNIVSFVKDKIVDEVDKRA